MLTIPILFGSKLRVQTEVLLTPSVPDLSKSQSTELVINIKCTSKYPEMNMADIVIYRELFIRG